MDYNWIFALVMGAIVLKGALRLYFKKLDADYARKNRGTVPANLADRVTPEAHSRSADYMLDGIALSAKEEVFGLMLKILVLVGGVLPWVYNATVETWGVQNIFAQVLAMSLTTIVLGICFWPFDWADTFKIEAKYGFNKTTIGTWWADNFRDIALGLAMGLPIMWVVLWMAQNLEHWWLWAWLIVTGYEIFETWIYPNVIAPLFNKFTPLPEGVLKERLNTLAKRCGLKFNKLLVMDGSRRSAHANAYFTGFGSSRQVVLYDTLLGQVNDEEVEAVLAHEIGHLKHRHILQQLFLGIVLQLLGFYLMDFLIRFEPLYRAFGFSPENGVAGAFFLISYISGAFTFYLTPLFAAWSRKHEYEADKMAAQLCGNPMPLVMALRKMKTESLQSIKHHPLVYNFYASHPQLEEREMALGVKV